MDSTHDWQRKEDVVDKNGEPGYYLECSKCKHRFITLKKWNNFQVQLDVVMYFMEVVKQTELSEEIVQSLAVPGEYNMMKGIHGVLSEDCEAAQNFPALANVLHVMKV